jgi:hypothetical protein
MAVDEDPLRVGRRSLLKWSAVGAATVAGVAGGALATTASADPLPAAGDRIPARRPKDAVVASRFGWHPLDSTAALQAAINAALDATHQRATTLVIDQQPGDWVTGPLLIGPDPAHPKGSFPLTVLFEPGVTVRALAGAYDGQVLADIVDVCLITVAAPDAGGLVSGVSFLGYGATLAMNKPEYNAGEWRHVLAVLSCDTITVEGLTLRDSGGDGIYLGVRYNKAHNAAIGQPYNSNVTLCNVRCDNNRRNALSVISVDGLLIESCVLSGSFGTPPMAGIDFEPDPPRTPSAPFAALPYGRLKNIVVRDTALVDNAGYAVNVNALCLAGAPAECGPLDIQFQNVLFGATTADNLGTFVCSSSGDNGDPTPITQGGIGTGAPIPGQVTVTDSLIDARLFAAAIRTQAMPADAGFQLSFTRTGLFNNSYTRAGTYTPIALVAVAGANTAVRYGGASWTDCVVNSNQANPLVKGYPLAGNNNSVCAGLAGSLTAYVPSPNAGAPTLNVPADQNSLTVPELQAPYVRNSSTPMPIVSVAASSATARPGDTVVFTFTRTGGDNSKMLAVAFGTSGNAVPRYDFDGLSGVAVFAPGATTATTKLVTRRPDQGHDQRTVTVEILHSDACGFQTPTRTASVTIG